MPLSEVEEGVKAEIISIEGCRGHAGHKHRHQGFHGNKDRFKNRLGDLGLYEGATIKVVKNHNTGPMVLKVLDSRVLLGRGQAHKIKVKVL